VTTTSTIRPSRKPRSSGLFFVYCPAAAVRQRSPIAPRKLPTEQTPVCKRFKLPLPLAIELPGVRLERTANAYLVGGKAMLSRVNQGPRGSVNSMRFEALLDKLVAVQMDLEPVCGVGTERAQVVASLAAIADACSVLRSAIADVRNIIHQADGLI
jgi:hypothetical protein